MTPRRRRTLADGKVGYRLVTALLLSKRLFVVARRAPDQCGNSFPLCVGLGPTRGSDDFSSLFQICAPRTSGGTLRRGKIQGDPGAPGWSRRGERVESRRTGVRCGGRGSLRPSVPSVLSVVEFVVPAAALPTVRESMRQSIRIPAEAGTTNRGARRFQNGMPNGEQVSRIGRIRRGGVAKKMLNISTKIIKSGPFSPRLSPSKG